LDRFYLDQFPNPVYYAAIQTLALTEGGGQGTSRDSADSNLF